MERVSSLQPALLVVILVSIIMNVWLVYEIRTRHHQSLSTTQKLRKRISDLEAGARSIAMKNSMDSLNQILREEAEETLDQLPRLLAILGPSWTLNHLLDLSQKFPTSSKIHLEAGALAYRIGDQKKSQHFLTQAVLSDPSASAGLMLLSFSYDLDGDSDRARFFAEQTVESNPDGAYGFLARAYLASAQEESPRSIRSLLDHAISLRPKLPFGYILRARTWIQDQQPDRARSDLHRARKIDPRLQRIDQVESLLSPSSTPR
jgi:tetratricopeptide (TPR) repeat protein